MAADIEQLLKILSNSGIISERQLKDLQRTSAARAKLRTVEDFTSDLVSRGYLTEFQASEVCRGKAQHLVFGDYLLVDSLGAGGMGRVYRARHVLMNREVAIKLLTPETATSAEGIRRFRREVEAAAKLSHPNVVTAFDAGQHGDQLYLVMEYVPGQDLRRYVREHGVFPVPKAVDCIAQAAAGLDYAHKRGLVHRDVKPSNLFLCRDGTVKVLDLGLALWSEFAGNVGESPESTDITDQSAIIGTVDYMAPEQAVKTHEVDHRSDIYGLGCSLHYLLTGRPPYSAETVVGRLVAHRESPVPQLPIPVDLPGYPPLHEIFQRMMAKSPSDRYQSMSALLTDLRTFQATASAQEMSETVRIKPPLWSRYRLALTAAILAIGVTAVGLLQSLRNTPRDSSSPAQSASDPDSEALSGSTAEVPAALPLDLFNLVSLDQNNVVSGQGWRLEDNSLLTAPGPSTLQVPLILPPEYELHFAIVRISGSGPAVVGLKVNDHQCYLLLDGGRPGGKSVTGIGTDRQGRMAATVSDFRLPTDQPVRMAIRVFQEGITVSAESTTILEWKGSFDDLRLGGGWKVPDRTALFFGANNGSVFRFSELRVEPVVRAP